jgi:hypothetical protein
MNLDSTSVAHTHAFVLSNAAASPSNENKAGRAAIVKAEEVQTSSPYKDIVKAMPVHACGKRKSSAAMPPLAQLLLLMKLR